MTRTIAYITDIHLGERYPQENGVDAERNWRRILDDVASRDIKEVVFGGDIGDKECYKKFFDSLRAYKLMITLGNHDNLMDVRPYELSSLSAANDGLYYSYEDDYFKCIFLDSSSEQIVGPQYQWFLLQLNTEKKIVLFIHHPILPVNTEVDRKYPLHGRQELQDTLQALTQKVYIFCGHYHLLDEQSDKNIEQFITPAASFQMLKSNKIVVDPSVFGYRIIHVEENSISSEVIMMDAD
jgi:3',5'-cyclic-AMP phosphodiesterase